MHVEAKVWGLNQDALYENIKFNYITKWVSYFPFSSYQFLRFMVMRHELNEKHGIFLLTKGLIGHEVFTCWSFPFVNVEVCT